MATLTPLDILNAVSYLTNRDTLSYIMRWREKFPHILIDYTIRWASNDDYYVPPSMVGKTAIVVNIHFSKEGCESMSCYPYTETGVIDYVDTPIGGFTQTSNTTVQYNQPACFNLDPSLASRNGEIQSVELRYTSNRQCIMVDTFTKLWMNTPYIRTSKHVVRGVDDVPGFDVTYDDDPAFPERIRGRFNQAYCARFGRNETNNSCTRPWYETFVSFIIGDSVLSTFKMATGQVASDLHNFNYVHPSGLLPHPPPPGGITLLEEWYRVRDSTVDVEMENDFLKNIFPFGSNEEVVYTANKGFSIGRSREYEKGRCMMKDLMMRRNIELNKFNLKKNYNNNNSSSSSSNNNDDQRDLEAIISDFLDDHQFIMGILTDLGFSVLENALKNLFQQINKVLIPALKRMLLIQSKRMTVALLGQTYRAAMIHTLNRAMIKTVSVVARVTMKAIASAASVVGMVLMFLELADFILMLWDPFGYNNMFPRGFLDDLSQAFLMSYYESVDAPNRDLIEFSPLNFSHFVVDEDEEEHLTEIMLHLVEYLAALDVNSNGQMINLLDGEEIDDFDENDLLGVTLATNDTWLFFKNYCARHDALLPTAGNNKLFIGIGLITCVGGLLYYLKNYENMLFRAKLHVELLLLVLVVLCCLLIIYPSYTYYTRIISNGVNKESGVRDRARGYKLQENTQPN
ncbi:P74 [Diatraea saccharalis granulovirus]|uniref:p74 n=1 Tax=Diatraea saccharalis granulovirus TaxID=1675862 RepID=A0A0R7EYX7_9BBAC|nr:P74 [Diatraea saccharalis granulovirus]AKN80793.1 P74 [Diatraea saccharalis granulovirus]